MTITVESETGQVSGATEVVARFACTRQEPVGPPGTDRLAAATRSLVDTVGVALAGRSTPAVRAVRAWVGVEPAAGASAVWGEPGGRGASQAALVNGTAGHALDFDDACPSMPLHPSTVLWPALLALSNADTDPDTARETDPGLLVEALDVGNAVVRALGEALPMDAHYGRGWHSTATVGRLGAVAALARLRGLTVDQTRHALGVVASMAGGSIANFGTGTKPLHAGLAARDAVIAVRMVENGLDAATDQLEHRLGFLALFGEPTPLAVGRLEERLRHWERHWTEDWSLKRFPSCYGTHRAVDAVLELRSEIAAAIECVDVQVHPGSLRPLIDHLPATGTEAKFSLPFTVARALLTGGLVVGDFTDAALADPALEVLMPLVHVTAADTPPGRADLSGTPYAHVCVRLVDGTQHERLVLLTRGDSRNPLTDAEADQKFLGAIAAVGWPEPDGRALLEQVRVALTGPGALAQALTALAADPPTIPDRAGERP
ncbi:MmgE/PrpD family protein [Nocardioides sp. W7]|uniref:MmgE/PrpD family protein n=1 Tax=Nocardioides sp. W7 TaxID=2931390 RepID=UPI001FD4D3A1|nr:MmgE/PrpD family protein [Nocardioides sp. W7]